METSQQPEENIRTGMADVKPTALTHVYGVRAGNNPGKKQMPGHLPNGRSTARRSTGINADDRDPILPEMPNLSPA
jgi:hypothetical protein